MAAPTTPYTTQLGGLDPLVVLPDAIDRIERLGTAWSAGRFGRPLAPGKWTVAQVLTHLAQIELVFGYRARMALAAAGFVVRPFDQDAWLALEPGLDGRTALAAFVGLARMNAAFYGRLSMADRSTSFVHPEYGQVTVDWIVHLQAGHLLHHLRQLESIER